MISIAQVADHVRAGGIVVYPTESSYAIGCAYNNRSAIRSIMKFKGRTDPKFTLIAASLEQVEQYFTINSIQRTLAKKYWPGPLSLVISKKFAIRVPAIPAIRRLANVAGVPLLATSFNKTGAPPIFNIESPKVQSQVLPMLPKNTLIMNAGRLPKRMPSTIVEVKGSDVIIHRSGPIRNPHV